MSNLRDAAAHVFLSALVTGTGTAVIHAQPKPYVELPDWIKAPENRVMRPVGSAYTDADRGLSASIPIPSFNPSLSEAIGAHGIRANAVGEIFGAELDAATVRKYMRP